LLTKTHKSISIVTKKSNMKTQSQNPDP